MRGVRTGRTIGAAIAGVALVLAVAHASSAAGDGRDVSFDQHRIDVAEGAGRASVTLRRATTAALEETDVTWATYERTATEGRDYGGTSGRARLAVGQTTYTITTYLIDDSVDEQGDESFSIRLYSGASAGEAIDEVVITIHDDDDPDTPVASLDAAAVTPAAPTRASESRPVTRPLPQANARPSLRPSAPSGRARRQAPPAPRVTPFEIRGPAQPAAESLPVPDHVPPIAAASLLAALALARVSAETWYRWRLREL